MELITQFYSRLVWNLKQISNRIMEYEVDGGSKSVEFHFEHSRYS